jgi:hypothetical protein
VELMVKTYLGLPERVTNISVSKREYDEVSGNFSRLLDALQKHSPEKLSGVNAGEIEWFHRLRNQLYHEGNGVTVDKDKVGLYAAAAQILFRNLFGVELQSRKDSDELQRVLGFRRAWDAFEWTLFAIGRSRVDPTQSPHLTVSKRARSLVQALRQQGAITPATSAEIMQMLGLMNSIRYVTGGQGTIIPPGSTERLADITADLKTRFPDIDALEPPAFPEE